MNDETGRIHEFVAEQIYTWVDPGYDHMDTTIVTDFFTSRGWDTEMDDNDVLWFLPPTKDNL